ncbi:MAG: hypothetical protein WEB33_05535 [Bacteroidota bacterium]
MIRRLTQREWFLPVVFLALFLQACVNEPGVVGSGLIPATDLTQADTLDLAATRSSGFSSVSDSLTTSVVVAIGKTPNLEAWGLVIFDGFASVFDSIAVQSAELRFRATYHLGDSLGQFSLAVRKALSSWRRPSFTYSDLRQPGFYEEPARSTHNAGSIGDTADIAIPLDTALVNSWFRADSANQNFGIVLEPTNTTVIKGFITPQLYVVYIHPDSTDADTTSFTAPFGDYMFVAQAADTSFLQDSTSIRLRGGASYRGIVDFDIAALPRFSAVHRALLELSADAAGSDFSSAVSDSVMAIFIDSQGLYARFEAISDVFTTSGQKIYSINITPFVQFWTQGVGLPRVGLRIYSERNEVDGLSVHGSAAPDPALRPKLRIIYSSTTRP